jgi:hypothetical protein
VAVIAASITAFGVPPERGKIDALKRQFLRPPDDSRIMMRWWWFGPAVTKPELEREMRSMKAAGIGGFEVQPVYPLELDNADRGIRNLPFLSPDFLDVLQFTSVKARELGLRADLTLGSGWPYGGPQISITLAAGRLRCERVPIAPGGRAISPPPPKEGEKLIAAFLAKGDPGSFSPGSIRQIAIDGDGALPVPASSEPQVALVFFSSRTGMMVKRAAAGAEGYVLDHYDRAALDRYLATVGEPLLKAFGANPPYAVFCDSLEVFGSDWTGDFLAEFQKRRGYDLTPYLPALVGDAGPNTGAIRNDWGLTLTELAEERFLAPLTRWAARHGTRFRAQAYGVPPVALSSNRLVELPEGEGSFWNRLTPTRMAASAAHLFGRPVVSAETWTWLHSPAFRATPLDLKAEADRQFLQGINQLVGHGWPYSPPSAGEPGWRFYAAGALNDHNPWWIVMPDLATYLQRVSYLLRQGRETNDVALYLPSSDARASFAAGRVALSDTLQRMVDRSGAIPQILEAGFNFDLVDDRAIQDSGRITGGALEINGNRFPVLVLPNVERLPLKTYRALESFVRAGGSLIATGREPSLPPGLEEQPQTAEVHAISQRLFDGPAARGLLLGEEGAGLAEALGKLRNPDVALSPAAPNIGFVHRTTDFAEIYFLANTGNTAQHTLATFRVRDLEPEWWDLFAGTTAAARFQVRADGALIVALDLEPYESRVLVFSKAPPSGASGPPAPARLPGPVDLSTGWKVSFANIAGPVEFAKLRSWTDDPETRFYSGQVTYRKTVPVGPDLLQSGISVYLDFGEGTPVAEGPRKRPGMRAWLESPVREAAVVYVNGQRAGSVWHPPYRTDVTHFLHPGDNNLEVIVANLAINKLAGSPPPDYSALVRKYGNRFDPQDMSGLQPLPSGLLGPVRLLVEATETGLASHAASRCGPERLRRQRDGHAFAAVRQSYLGTRPANDLCLPCKIHTVEGPRRTLLQSLSPPAGFDSPGSARRAAAVAGPDTATSRIMED